MPVEGGALPVVSLPGLPPDSLGNYLASLGLFRVLAREWPDVRAAWRESTFCLVGGPATLDALLEHLYEVARRRRWTPYTRSWAAEQKRGTKAKSGTPLALWQASAPESELEMLAAHAVPAGRVSFNPLLGSGGNAGKRDFSKGWKAAVDALATAKSGKRGAGVPVPDKHSELKALVLGEPVNWLVEKLNAACWFSDANKLYNSGQRPYREGAVSPWSMAFACEGLRFFAGSASRRLGARAVATGAFPFVIRPAAPRTSGEAGRDRAEVWSPIWERPMTVREAHVLFSRGRAEVRGRGALTPSAFATAVLRRGIDAGIAEFRRFVLGKTTSANAFEPRFEGVIRVDGGHKDRQGDGARSVRPESIALERLLGLVERLPRDRKEGKRWRFVGLRGPLEAAMVRVVECPRDPEAARLLLDTAVLALDRVDRNRAFRAQKVEWEPLPLEWVPALFSDEAPGTEARLALALVSGFPARRPFALYRFGVQLLFRRRFLHPERAPASWAWHPGPLASLLASVVLRQTLDQEAARDEAGPSRAEMPVSTAIVDRWLAGGIDEALFARWISRLALFDWTSVPPSVAGLARREARPPVPSALLCLQGLFQPLLDLRPVYSRALPRRDDLLPPETGARTPAVARRLVRLLRVGQVDAAFRFASGRYSMAGVPVVSTDVSWDATESDRLLASLLFPLFDFDRALLLERWLRPRPRKGE